MTSGTSYSPPPAFGRFKLLHQIGAGVLGPVFRTHDPDQDRLVAVKALTLDLTPEQATALAAEFQRLAALNIDAPCVAAPIAAGVEEFVPYVAVPYVSGESLDAAVRQYGPAPAGDAIRLIAHVADALDAAASVGVHHGSLHPRDIIVTPGETHVTGFGVAQALERVGLHGPVRRPYVAPEREGGEQWGAAADIYALAAIAYEVLTGRRALPGTEQPLPGLNDLRVHDAAALRDVIESALDADPGRRPAHAGDFAAGFAAALSEAAGGGRAGERAPDRRARKPRTRPPKLPGLDEPLSAREGTGRERPRSVVPIVPFPAAPVQVPPPVEEAPPGPILLPVEEASPAPAPPPVEPAPAESAVPDVEAVAPVASAIRYVPVTDPADAGEAALARTPPTPAPLELPRPGLATGLTPDLRLADELMSRAETDGETVDPNLAAALDRFSPDRGTSPTPAIIGSDMLGPGLSPADLAAGGPGADLAAETRLGYQASGGAGEPVRHGEPAGVPGVRQSDEDLSLDLSALDTAADFAPTPSGPGSGLAGVDALQRGIAAITPAQAPVPEEPSGPAAQPPRPFARGRAGERRRPSPRFGRFDSILPSPTPPGSEDTGVPRAFEEGRLTPPVRPVPDFELLTRPAPRRLPLVPVILGVVGGVVLGMAAGYWLGTRAVPEAGSPPAQAAASPPSAPVAQGPAGPAANAQRGSPPATPAAPPSAAIPPPAAAETARPPVAETTVSSAAGAVRGSIQVTASQQANVYLDGERVGMTPRSLRNVPLGRHTVRVTRPGYATQEQAVLLTAEEPASSMTFTLRRADAAPAASPAQAPAAGPAQAPAVKSVLVVLVESNPPGARVRIDGRDLAPTPLTVRQMRPGTHTIELRLPGYKTWSQRVTVAAGDNRRITATLERDTPR